MGNVVYSNAEYYEQLADTRWGRYLTSVERWAVLAAHRRAAAPSLLLDVGAAGGRWSQLLSDLGWRAICTDVNKKSLAVCQSRLPNATCILVEGDDETLPVGDSSIDLILCMGVFSVMPTSWFLQEATRALRPGGLLVGEFNNKCSVRGLLKSIHYRLQGSSGLNYYSTCYKTWKKQLQSNDFEMLEEEGICWMPFSISSDSHLVDPLVALERHFGLRRIPNLSPRVVFLAKKNAPV